MSLDRQTNYNAAGQQGAERSDDGFLVGPCRREERDLRVEDGLRRVIILAKY